MVTELQVLADVRRHQLTLVDADRPRSAVTGWDNDWRQAQVGVADRLLTIFTARAGGRVPLSVRVLPAEPALDERYWSGLVEAHLHCPSGQLSVPAGEGPSATLAIPPVPHRALVAFGDVDSGGFEMHEGADHFLVLLWPGEPRSPRVRKAPRPVERARVEPSLSFAEATALARSDEPHERFHAAVELARHGTDAALEVLMSSADTELARHHAVQALGLSHPFPMGAIERFAVDPSPKVRAAALTVVEDALFEVGFGRRSMSELERFHDLVHPRLSDLCPAPRAAAEAILRTLDEMAQALGEAGATEGAPAQSSELERAARAYVAALIDRSLVEVNPDFDRDLTAEVLIEAVAQQHARSGVGAALAEALLGSPGVAEVFATDDDLETLLREE